MKTKLAFVGSVVLALFCFADSQGQDSKKFISFSFSNNGQIQDLVDEYHFNVWGIYPSNTKEYKVNKIKLDALMEVGLRNNFYLVGKIGYGYKLDKYIYDVSVKSNGKITQHFYDLGVGLTYRIKIEKITLSTGLYVPFYKISDFTRHENDNNVGSEQVIDATYKGGFAMGLSNISSIRINVFKNIYLVSTMSFGALYLNLGGHYSQKQDFKDPNATDLVYSGSVGLYKSTQISKPDLSIGIGYSFN
jgi:hypothetical protein